MLRVLCALQFYETGLVDPKLWPFGDDLRERFELTRVSCHFLLQHSSGCLFKMPQDASSGCFKIHHRHHCGRAAAQCSISFCCAKLPLPV